MDYEKLYKEALERARQFSKKPYLEDSKDIVEYIFPELKEDEKISREITEFLVGFNNGGYEIPNENTIDSWLAWLEKQGEQKPADKVEPKFKVEKGKWYVCTQTFVLRGKIVIIKGQTYQAEKDNVIKGENGCRFIDRHDGKASDYFRPWTIQDAKDGDVLSDEKPFIFRGFGDREHPHNPTAYCGITSSGTFILSTENEWWTADDFYPATKEQCDLLFQKMHEVGYEWDDEKKELKRIDKQCEQIHAEWSEKDEENLNWVINVWNRLRRGGDAQTTPNQMEMLENWLKSIKDKVQPQSKQEWSEGDRTLQDSSISYLCNLRDIFEAKGWDKEQIQKCIDWLKSFRHNHWKPSEQNIKDLEWCADLAKDKMGVGFHRLQVFIDEIKNL